MPEKRPSKNIVSDSPQVVVVVSRSASVPALGCLRWWRCHPQNPTSRSSRRPWLKPSDFWFIVRIFWLRDLPNFRLVAEKIEQEWIWRICEQIKTFKNSKFCPRKVEMRTDAELSFLQIKLPAWLCDLQASKVIISTILTNLGCLEKYFTYPFITRILKFNFNGRQPKISACLYFGHFKSSNLFLNRLLFFSGGVFCYIFDIFGHRTVVW